MRRYQVVLSGTIHSTWNTREEAEKVLDQLRHSIFALVHPTDCMRIKEI